jgi:hypothetical protein
MSPVPPATSRIFCCDEELEVVRPGEREETKWSLKGGVSCLLHMLLTTEGLWVE